MSVSKPSICVVAPSYNHEEFIEECIESIAKQSNENFDVDIILIDDCSTDKTYDVACEYLGLKYIKNKFRNIVTIRNSYNRGAHANYNAALKMVQADIVHFMNTDDYLENNRFEEIISEFLASQDEQESFWGFGKVKLVDEKSQPFLGDGFWQYLTHILDYSEELYPSKSFFLIKNNLAISTGNIFISATLARKIDGFEHYKYVHDWDFVLKSMLHAEPRILSGPNSCYMYRHHPGNTFKQLEHIGHIESYEVLFGFLRQAILGKPANSKVISVANYGADLFYAFLSESPGLKAIADRVLNIDRKLI